LALFYDGLAGGKGPVNGRKLFIAAGLLRDSIA